MMTQEITKSFAISKRMVYNSYLKVCEKKGSAGIDKETIEMFNQDLSKNLYKLWNRMASGSYMPPPVRTVLIPKKQGGKRPLGIPTVGDRIGQGVVKDFLEPEMETIFHKNSFGYRPGRSAHDALKQCHENCNKYSWVIDVDIKGFFDNINQELMMQLLHQHTQEKWVLLYVNRSLKASVEQEDGSIIARTKGTPQGGVISPQLANLYLHHAFDKWMDEINPRNPFERYADDIIIHCQSREGAERILAQLKDRLQEFSLELHPEKTKIVFCKNFRRHEKHDKEESFTFLSYSFQPRTITDKFGRRKQMIVFSPAISTAAKTHIRTRIREILIPRQTTRPLAWFATQLNPKIRGWINYYTKFNKTEGLEVFYHLNFLIHKWIGNKYKIRYKGKIHDKYLLIHSENPTLFYHWRLGIIK
jgi:RNA-directed DNA polymerase